MIINISREGVFPIIYDKDNNKINKEVGTNLNIGGSIQGEGIYIGVPSLFFRVSGCQLRCCFGSDNFVELCDTEYTSWKPDIIKEETDNIIKLILNNLGNINHLVISGGEPLMQQKQLIEILKEVKKQKTDLIVTIETNGVIKPIEELVQYVDLFSVSPKLSSSNPTEEKCNKINVFYVERTFIQHNKLRYNLEVLQNYIKLKKQNKTNIQFKFVVTSTLDVEEIKEQYINKLKDINKNDIILMPVGRTQEHLKEVTDLVLYHCIDNGFRFSNRLHIDLFGSKIGV